jgi:hypothetical protein
MRDHGIWMEIVEVADSKSFFFLKKKKKKKRLTRKVGVNMRAINMY